MTASHLFAAASRAAMLALLFTLEIGNVAEAIVVTAEAPLLQTANAEISDVIESREVANVPLNGAQ